MIEMRRCSFPRHRSPCVLLSDGVYCIDGNTYKHSNADVARPLYVLFWSTIVSLFVNQIKLFLGFSGYEYTQDSSSAPGAKTSVFTFFHQVSNFVVFWIFANCGYDGMEIFRSRNYTHPTNAHIPSFSPRRRLLACHHLLCHQVMYFSR